MDPDLSLTMHRKTLYLLKIYLAGMDMDGQTRASSSDGCYDNNQTLAQVLLREVDCGPGVDLDYIYSDSPSPVSCGFMEGFGLDLGLDSGLPISTVRHSLTGPGGDILCI